MSYEGEAKWLCDWTSTRDHVDKHVNRRCTVRGRDSPVVLNHVPGPSSADSTRGVPSRQGIALDRVSLRLATLVCTGTYTVCGTVKGKQR